VSSTSLSFRDEMSEVKRQENNSKNKTKIKNLYRGGPKKGISQERPNKKTKRINLDGVQSKYIKPGLDFGGREAVLFLKKENQSGGPRPIKYNCQTKNQSEKKD